MDQYDIFISYRRIGGKNYARTLKPELEKRGFRVFLDFDELKDGVFDKRIMDAINEAPIFLVILSKGALDRCVNEGDWVREEILYAEKSNRHIVPVEFDKTFREFPENLPDEVKSVLGPHQFSQIDTETLLQESIDKMVRDRIKPYVTKESTKTPIKEAENTDGAEIHIEVDADCDLFRFKKLLKTLYAGKDNVIHLMPGKHKIEVVSKEHADIKESQVISIPSIQYSDFIEISLSARIESKKQEEIRLQEELKQREETKRKAEEEKRKAEEEAKRKAEEAKRKAGFDACRKKEEEEEERRKLAEEFKRKAEKKKAKEEAVAKRRAEKEKRRAEVEAKKKIDEKKHNAKETYQRGKVFYDNENYSNAYPLILAAAEQGHAAAQNILGYMYYYGRGVKQDYAEAVKWYRKAAEQGYADAQLHLGIMYDNGEGGIQDYAEAVKWYRKAAKQGNAIAQTILGYMYDNGQGVKQDYAEAEKWYRKAAEQGNANAQNNLGYMYDFGRGVNQDYAEAKKWYRKAAEQGNAAAQNNLGHMYDFGRGVNQDYAEAKKWYRKAAEQGNAAAQNHLGYMYDNGRGVKQDYAEAEKWYRKAAEQGHAAAQCNLGYMYANGRGVKQDYAEAEKWYRKAAEQGDPDAQNKLDILLKKEDSKPHHVIKVGGKCGYADRNGKVVISCQWTKANEFVDGVGLVWDEKKMGAIDEHGKYYFPCKVKCDEASCLGHGLIKSKDGSLYSIHDLTGKDVEYELFTTMGDEFVNGYLYAVKYRLFGKNKPGRIDTKGKFIED